MNSPPVYLMDCEQRCAEGVLYSLARNGCRVIGLTSVSFFPMRFSRHLASWYSSPTLSEGFEEYLQFLKSLPEAGVILPSGDLSVKFLARYFRELTDAGFMLSVPGTGDLETLFDKLSCNRACANAGIPVAKTWSLSELEDDPTIIERLRWPVIVKPTALAGGNYRKVEETGELEQAIDYISGIVQKESVRLNESGVVIQEWIDSGMTDNWSCDVFCDSQGRIVDHVTIQRVRTSLNEKGTPTSRMYCGVFQPEPRLLERTEQLLKAHRWKGFAHVEYIYCSRDEEFYLTEVNPRLPGYSYLLSATGHEQGWYYVADLIGVDYDSQGKDSGVVYFESLRYPGDLTDGVVNAVRGNLDISTLLSSYWRALFSPDQVVIDHFNRKDLGLTFGLVLFNVRTFIEKAVSYIRRRMLKNGFARKA
ncbi:MULTISPECIES: ATP-grasp domain-containing protein [unclassified Marinobacter]|uniref:ATP-binding protein n=1 Tax=unclassified Marinobacter TaxID=83889 RepID=UPI00126916E1|nr:MULTISPECIES: ATP-grasp domain-containing protein [unclassified Marinobacter]QFS86934.1 carbamoyl phosphate synthase-like protein [Marinobacter sp. THAF197a]QFT50718.1 carbamoyl phosphate synthase-like protein [Marinobacter sp. THAF39]